MIPQMDSKTQHKVIQLFLCFKRDFLGNCTLFYHFISRFLSCNVSFLLCFSFVSPASQCINYILFSALFLLLFGSYGISFTNFLEILTCNWHHWRGFALYKQALLLQRSTKVLERVHIQSLTFNFRMIFHELHFTLPSNLCKVVAISIIISFSHYLI